MLPLTGERTVPGVADENYWFRRHEAAYAWLAPRADGRRVLEVGCGEGYGTALLAERAESIFGVDYDALTVAHAARTYPSGSLRPRPISRPCRYARRRGRLVASLQVIEHVWDHTAVRRRVRRVLRPHGDDGRSRRPTG